MRTSKALLLDVDGVVYQNPRVFSIVKGRVTQFVQKTLPKVSLHEASHINDIIYKSYGHTFLGLQAIRPAKTPTLKEFNDFVYDKDTLYSVMDNIWNPVMHKRSMEVHDLCNYAKMNGVSLYLFSNAPKDWCNNVIEAMKLQDYFHEDNTLSSDHPVFQGKLLKPTPKLYQTVQDFVQHRHQDTNIPIIFVDDSWMNLAPVIGNPAWKPIYMDNTEGGKIQTNSVCTVNHLHELLPLV